MPKLHSPRFLVTGGQGFLGSYIIKGLINKKTNFALFDKSPDESILSQVLESAPINGFQKYYGDISDYQMVDKVIRDFRPTHIIHLAALQVPSCRNNPILGAQVNVIGTLNIFESVKQYNASNKDQEIQNIVYASSAAVAGPPEDYKSSIDDNTPHKPLTHYGVFKIANEQSANIYWREHKISSVGFRPHTIYGVGREQGITSGPSKAIKASILNRKYQIPFSGKTSFQFVEDVADLFLAASFTKPSQALCLNIRGNILPVEEFVKILNEVVPQSRGLISVQDGAPTLPLAFDFAQKGLDSFLPHQQQTSIADGIKKTVDRFQELLKQGKLHDRDLS